MLDYVTTSLFASPAQTLVNTVNTVGVMGKGIAAEFKKRYPDMFKQYAAFCKASHFEVGQLWIYRTEHKWVLNFPTKKHWRNPSTLEYVEAGLKKFVETYSQQGITSVSFPQLGCGNGGLDWQDVRPMMERYLEHLAIPVFIHQAERPRHFVPEHESRAALKENLRARRAITFLEFLVDFLTAAGVDATQYRNAVIHALDFPPPIPLPITGGKSVEVALGDLEDLWHGLRVRGALHMDDFPGALRARPEIANLLTHLPYFRKIRFVGDGAGVQFAPGPNETEISAPISVGRIL